MRSVEEVFFSKVSGNFPEIFEKSIDKHKIDAILDAPSSEAALFLGCQMGVSLGWRILRKNPV